MSTASIICQGPTGIGYVCEVRALPGQDRGAVANRHGSTLVCDAAIVAQVCAKHYAGRVHLVTNNLGSVGYESDAIRGKLQPGVVVHSDSSPFVGAPIDIILIDRSIGTRSFVTTNYYPSHSHILAVTPSLYQMLSARSRTILYADIEVASDGGLAAIRASAALPSRVPSVWNLGQVGQLSHAEEWLSGIKLPEAAVIQVSLGDSSATSEEVRSIFRRISSSREQTLIVTLGKGGAAWANAKGAEVVVADSVPNAFTLGAGAVFASSLVLSLASGESLDMGRVVTDAVLAATDYVRSATLGCDMYGLDFW